MSVNVLVTGVTGYIGGSLLDGLLSPERNLFSKNQIYAAIRSPQHKSALSDLGINVLELDLGSEEAVTQAIVNNKIDLVIHTASGMDPAPAANLAIALGKRRAVTNKAVFFIHTSGTSVWLAENGFPFGVIKDTDPTLFEKEKKVLETNEFPLRKTDVVAIEESEKHGVTSFLLTPPLIYGRGKGVWNKQSALLPAIVHTAISQKKVYRFETNPSSLATHVSDLIDYYLRLTQKILEGAQLPTGKQGYYFPTAHTFHWWDVFDGIAKALRARGIAESDEVLTWSYEEAQGTVGIDAGTLQKIYGPEYLIIAENKDKIGWVPAWDEKKFLERLDNEVQDVLDLGIEKVGLLSAIKTNMK